MQSIRKRRLMVILTLLGTILVGLLISWFVYPAIRVNKARTEFVKMGGAFGKGCGFDTHVTGYLVGPGVGDEEFREAVNHLKHIPNLNSLLLRNTGVTDEGIFCLVELNGLKFVNLQGTKVTQNGVQQLLASRPELRVQCDSDPSRTGQPPVGGSFVAFERLPQAYAQRRKAWREALADWRKDNVMSAENIKGTAGSGGNFAQSFVPNSPNISAVEIAIYRVADTGWLRVDIAEDDNGYPSCRTLARTWVRMDTNCPFRLGDFAPVDLPNIQVTPGKTYWLCVWQFGTQTNWRLSSSRDSYTNGRLLLSGSKHRSLNDDVLFRVLTESPAVPFSRLPYRTEVAALPPMREANLSWIELSMARLDARNKHEAYQEWLRSFPD